MSKRPRISTRSKPVAPAPEIAPAAPSFTVPDAPLVVSVATPETAPAFDPTNPMTNGTTGRPVEGDQNDGDQEKSGSDAEGVTQGQEPASAPVAPVEPATLEKTPSEALTALEPSSFQAISRENLIGTLADWAAAGSAEIDRVSDLLFEHEWSVEEAGIARAAMDRIAQTASAAMHFIQVTDALPDLLEKSGLKKSDVLVFDPATGVAVTVDGRKVRAA